MSTQAARRNVQRLKSTISQMQGKASRTIPLSPSSVYNLDIPRMWTATMWWQNNCITLDFRNRKKYLKLPFWIRPASWQAATAEPERTSSCCSYKHKKRWKAPAGSIHASNNHYNWNLFCWKQGRYLPLAPKRQEYAHLAPNDRVLCRCSEKLIN